MRSPIFSIIVPHYQGSVSHERFLEGIESLQNQTFQDFEILCYHDGPLLDDNVEFPIPVICTKKRVNNWGHSLRDRGIWEAKGEYIVHFNPDNLLYPTALEEINAGTKFDEHLFETGEKNPIVVFPIKMLGMMRNATNLIRIADESVSMILTGMPAVLYSIDCMQLVMKTSLWKKNNGWYDKRENSDGYMYPLLVAKYNAFVCGDVLGVHR